MGKVDRDGHGGEGERKPPLTPDVLGGVDFAVLTVEDVRTNIRIGERLSTLIEFQEYPDYVFWLNVTSLDAIIERYGEETDDWKGERVPLEKVTTMNPKTHRRVEKYWVPGGKAWDEVMDEHRQRRRRGTQRKAKPKAKPKKRARKK